MNTHKLVSSDLKAIFVTKIPTAGGVATAE
jgi:hypothetical protein